MTYGRAGYRWVLPAGLLVAVTGILVVQAWSQTTAEPYLLDLRTACFNMISLDFETELGGKVNYWHAITEDDIPAQWFGTQVQGSIVRRDDGVTFSADGVELDYNATSKWGPCHGPSIGS